MGIGASACCCGECFSVSPEIVWAETADNATPYPENAFPLSLGVLRVFDRYLPRSGGTDDQPEFVRQSRVGDGVTAFARLGYARDRANSGESDPGTARRYWSLMEYVINEPARSARWRFTHDTDSLGNIDFSLGKWRVSQVSGEWGYDLCFGPGDSVLRFLPMLFESTPGQQVAVNASLDITGAFGGSAGCDLLNTGDATYVGPSAPVVVEDFLVTSMFAEHSTPIDSSNPNLGSNIFRIRFRIYGPSHGLASIFANSPFMEWVAISRRTFVGETTVLLHADVRTVNPAFGPQIIPTVSSPTNFSFITFGCPIAPTSAIGYLV